MISEMNCTVHEGGRGWSGWKEVRKALIWRFPGTSTDLAPRMAEDRASDFFQALPLPPRLALQAAICHSSHEKQSTTHRGFKLDKDDFLRSINGPILPWEIKMNVIKYRWLPLYEPLAPITFFARVPAQYCGLYCYYLCDDELDHQKRCRFSFAQKKLK